MELIRYEQSNALPLEGGTNAFYIPVRRGDRLAGMVLHLDRKGDTGKREIGNDIMLVVTSGEGRLRSGGEIADLRDGDVCVLPGGMLHHIWTADSRMQVILMAIGSGTV